jgi:TonB family protein
MRKLNQIWSAAMPISSILILTLIVLAPAAPPAFAQTAPDASQPAAAATTTPRRVSSAEQEKLLKKKVDPVYPKEAFDAKITGIVTLDVTIGVDGKVTNVALRGKADNLLVKAAMDAVKQWVYKPTKDKATNMPIEVMTLVQLNFKVGD